MKKISNVINNSFLTKLILAFIIFSILFLLIRTALIIPKVENKQFIDVISNITKSLLITKEELKIIGKSIRMQKDLEIKLYKQKILTKLNEMKLDNSDIETKMKNSFINKYCIYSIKQKNQIKDNTEKNKWLEYSTDNSTKNFDKQSIFEIYMEFDEKILYINCKKDNLNPNHNEFERDLRNHIKTNLLINPNLKSTKVALFWLNPDLKKKDEVIYEFEKSKQQNKYNISRLSNVDNLPTGNLTLNDILEAKIDKPIKHKINNKDVLTWIIDLDDNKNKNFYLAYTLDYEEIEEKYKAKVLFLLPETLFAIGISFLFVIILFRRMLININKITKTAILVNQGDKNIRSNVRGDDDIGILGKSFDSMIDFFQNNINILDKKVEDKTKEIKKSLDEKEILLKEIHHRVKNNLALTISLIELQEEEIEDKKVRKVLLDIKERIFTMELLHRKLYESKDISKIDFKNYVIELVDIISNSYNISKNVICVNISKFDLNIETAMPFGLIINELLTNSFKYAFIDNNNPKIDINISVENKEILMIVKDNGKGLKDSFEQMSEKTLGLKLINIIVKFQLFGEIEYKNDNGAKFIIKGNIIDMN